MGELAATWAYAVAAAIQPEWLGGEPGVGGQPVRTVEAAGLAAAVTSVSLDEFGEEPLRRQLEDLTWLEAAAREHHRVIGNVARRGPVIPMRLATIYRSDAGVEAALAARREDFAAALARVTGRAEWGVKAYLAAAASPAGPGRRPPGSAAPGSGAAYLRQRRQQVSAGRAARRTALASAEIIHAALGRLAAATALRPPQSAQLSGQAGQMILNAAFLVDNERAAEFGAAADSLAGQHSAVRLVLTGPWPPYSFAAADQGGTAGPEWAA